MNMYDAMLNGLTFEQWFDADPFEAVSWTLYASHPDYRATREDTWETYFARVRPLYRDRWHWAVHNARRTVARTTASVRVGIDLEAAIAGNWPGGSEGFARRYVERSVALVTSGVRS